MAAWDANTGAAPKQPRSIQIEAGWAVTPDGRLAAVVQGEDIVFYEPRTGKEVRKLRNVGTGKTEFGGTGMNFLEFSPDGRALLGYSYSEGADGRQTFTLVAWDVATSRRLLGGVPVVVQPPSGGCRTPVALSPDGRWLAYGKEERIADRQGNAHWDCGIELWEVATGEAGPKIKTERGCSNCMTFAPDGRTLAVGWGNRSVAAGRWEGRWRHLLGSIQLWDLASGRELHCFSGHWNSVEALVFSPDGSMLASTSRDGTTLVWNLQQLVQPADARMSRQTPERLWATLTGYDEVKASRAIHRLIAAPDLALHLLRERLLQPYVPPSPEKASEWKAAFKDSRAEVRNRAITEIERFGLPAEQAAKRILDKISGTDPEAQDSIMRLSGIYSTLDRSPQYLAATRGAEVLERIGTSDAQQLLQKLAKMAKPADGPTTKLALAKLEASLKRSQEPKPSSEALWAALAGKDAAAAYRIIGRLSEDPKTALPLLRERLKPPAQTNLLQIEQWLNDLNSDHFAVRQQAVAGLKKSGVAAKTAMQRALQGFVTLEVRRRLEELLAKLDHGPEVRIAVRGVEVLERIGTPEARQMLEELARSGDSLFTAESQAALQRLEKQGPPPQSRNGKRAGSTT